MTIQDTRRERLRQLITERYKSQADFVAATGENQGEVSALLKDKSFGEKKARKLEVKCGLPEGWLDEGENASQASPAEGRQEGGSSDPIGGGPEWMNPDAYRLLTLYFSADDDGRSEIMNTALDYARVHQSRV
ncbi:hypothetical protein, partial [Massilia frigida]|uniref:hypothetical protein n=1 Tax=Massilia frigida TaxID=2609281 RepID=UPI001CB72C68